MSYMFSIPAPWIHGKNVLQNEKIQVEWQHDNSLGEFHSSARNDKELLSAARRNKQFTLKNKLGKLGKLLTPDP